MFLFMAKLNEIMEIISGMCGPGKRFENKNQLAEFLGMSNNDKPNFYKNLDGTSRPRADRLLVWMDKLGFSVLNPWEKQTDFRRELQDRADNVMTAMSELGISDADRAYINDVMMGRKLPGEGHPRATGTG